MCNQSQPQPLQKRPTSCPKPHEQQGRMGRSRKVRRRTPFRRRRRPQKSQTRQHRTAKQQNQEQVQRKGENESALHSRQAQGGQAGFLAQNGNEQAESQDEEEETGNEVL